MALTKAKTYMSDAFAAIHQTVSDMHEAGAVNPGRGKG